MGSLDQLNQASFKGVEFPCNSTTTTVGRAQIKHEFVNGTKNNIEDVGLNPRVYQLVAIFSGERYSIQRDRLLAAIEEGGRGVLIHPFYGRIEKAVARPVTFSETVSRLGRIEIPLTFDLDDSDGIPEKGFASGTEITENKNVMLATVADDVGANFSVNNSFSENFSAAKEKLNSFSGLLADVVTASTILPDSANPYRAKLQEFNRDINSLIGDPVRLGESITDLVGGLSGLYESPNDTLTAATGLFDFGADDSVNAGNTAGLLERNKNNTLLNAAIQASALAVAYDSSGGIDYDTVDDINEVSRLLEKQFQRIKYA